MPWEITRISDRGAREHYRFHVEGWNTEHRTPQSFSWSVRDVADERYVPSPDASDEVRAALAAAKVASDPARPCLACAREEQAVAGFPGIDRIQIGHTCGVPPAIYALDDEPLDDVEDFIRTNSDPDAPGLSPEQVEEIRHMMPGDTLHLGGGAGETFTLTRRR